MPLSDFESIIVLVCCPEYSIPCERILLPDFEYGNTGADKYDGNTKIPARLIDNQQG